MKKSVFGLALVLLLLFLFPVVASAGEYSLSPGGSSGGSLNDQNTADHWQVVLPEDGTLTVAVNGDSTLAVDLYLYGGNDGAVWLAGDSAGSASSRTVTPPGLKAGTYYIHVNRYSGSGGYSVTTQYTAQPLTNDAEPNDGRPEARAINPNSQAAGHLGYSNGSQTDAYDYWQVVLPEDGTLTVAVNGDSTLAVDLYLYGGSDGYVWLAGDSAGSASSRTVTPPGLKAGTYYIELSRYSGSGGYTVTTQFTAQPLTNDGEPNDSRPEARAISPNSQATGHLGYSNGSQTDAYDYWQIVLPRDGTLTVSVNGDGTLAVDLYFYGVSDGFVQLAGDSAGSASSRTVTLPDLKAGTYYIGLNHYSGSGGYTITTTFTGDTPAATDPDAITLTNHWSTGAAFDFTRGKLFSFWTGNPENCSDDLEMVGGPADLVLRGNLVDLGNKTLAELTTPPASGYASDIPAVAGNAYWAKVGESYYKFRITGIDLTLDQNNNATSMTFKYEKYVPSYQGDYQVWKKMTVTRGHVFAITFNQDIDPLTINPNIYVKDALGNSVITQPHQATNSKIAVMPHPDGYAPGEYTLYIEKGLCSTTGKALKKAIKMDFTVIP